MDMKVCSSDGEPSVTPLPLTLHVPNVEGHKKFSCHICDKKFNSRTHLNYHLESHSGKKHFLCPFCGKTFSTSSYVKIHGMSQHGIAADVKTYKCMFCDKLFMNKSHYDYHLQTHMGEKPYACDLCDKRFTSKAYLKIHRFRHEESNPENFNYSCGKCDKQLSNKSHLEYHLNSHIGKKASCSSCEKSFTSEQYLQIHNLKHKNNLPTTFPSIGPDAKIAGVCYICNRCFFSESDFKRHSELHAGLKYPCEICKTEFSCKELLELHLETCILESQRLKVVID